MDKHEAKLILSNFTLNKDDNNSRLQEAKNVAAQDPELKQWWDNQRESDTLIKAKLSEIKVPNDLHAALKESLGEQQQKRIRFARFRNYLAMAASFVLVGLLYFQYGIDRSDDYTGPLAQRAYDYSVDGPRLTYFNEDTQKIQEWLKDNGVELPSNLPQNLLNLEGIGCRPLNWSEQGVALMCFNAETVYHLFMAKKAEFPAFDLSEEIGYDHYKDGWTVSKWNSDSHVFVLTAKTTPSTMSGMLASYTP